MKGEQVEIDFDNQAGKIEPANLPDDYGTSAYEARWIREKLELPAACSTGDLQGEMHVICSRAFGYQKYIVAYKCDDKQGEIARLTVRCRELAEKLGCLDPDEYGRPSCNPPCIACETLSPRQSDDLGAKA